MKSIMVNGMPGKMAQIVAQVCAKRKFNVIPFSLTGEDMAEFNGFTLLKPAERENEIEHILEKYPSLIAVDYTHPNAANGNAQFYVKHKIPFVMGTTGGDRDALMQLVKNAEHPCVIAPNMAKQIVALQAMFEWTAKNFPGVFGGYDLKVIESHQKTKADTSGTAKALVKSFLEMGLCAKEPVIEMVRDEESQISKMLVPSEHLGGHAFHTYFLDSADKSVHFEFRHNVCGREIYAEGTADAVEFLAKKIEAGQGSFFDMVDVLRG
ncbi:MAG: dihydrodipicolinate reductase [Fibromonadaceae bacterium]|jgi:4-hydroxy-tetrahydrodipicolinate reductase|nr:dihydrodipicolinate reductase [Fibromonadaceae bacterium]